MAGMDLQVDSAGSGDGAPGEIHLTHSQRASANTVPIASEVILAKSKHPC